MPCLAYKYICCTLAVHYVHSPCPIIFFLELSVLVRFLDEGKIVDQSTCIKFLENNHYIPPPVIARPLSLVMAPAFPTKREVLLLTILLVTLLVSFNKREQRPPPPPSLGTHNDTPHIKPTSLQASSPQQLDSRLSWGSSPVPQTQIIAHVPGTDIIRNGSTA